MNRARLWGPVRALAIGRPSVRLHVFSPKYSTVTRIFCPFQSPRRFPFSLWTPRSDHGGLAIPRAISWSCGYLSGFYCTRLKDSSTMMNMEEWQRKLKAEKEAERRKKNESAAMLQGYRRNGLADEETKLSALRKAERERQMEAERLLHDYRSNDPVEVKQRKAAAAQIEADVVASTGKREEAIVTPGSVSAKAAAFNTSSPPPSNPGSPTPRAKKVANEALSLAMASSPALAAGSGSAPNNSTPRATEAMQEPAKEMGDDPPLDYREEQIMMGAMSDLSVDKPAERPVAEPEANPQTEASAVDQAEIRHSVVSDLTMDNFGNAQSTESYAPEEDKKETSEAPIEEEKKEDSRTFDEKLKAEFEHLIKPAEENSKDPEAPVEMEVLFSFGLVTSSEKPKFERYMTAVGKVMESMLTLDKKLADIVTYETSKGPVVKGYSFDPSYADRARRENVRRAVCIGAVPVIVVNSASIVPARDRIVEGLQESISTGRFMTLAQAARK